MNIKIKPIVVAALCLSIITASSVKTFAQEDVDVSSAQAEAVNESANDLSLAERVELEATRIELFPMQALRLPNDKNVNGRHYDVRYDLTYERFQPLYRVAYQALNSRVEDVKSCAERFDSYNAKEKALAMVAIFAYLDRANKRMFSAFDYDSPDESTSSADREMLLDVLRRSVDSKEIPFSEVDGDKASWESALRKDFVHWHIMQGRRNPLFLTSFEVEKSSFYERVLDFALNNREPTLYMLLLMETDPAFLSRTQDFPYEYVGSPIFWGKTNLDESPISDEELAQETKMLRAFLLTQHLYSRYYFHEHAPAGMHSLSANFSDRQAKLTLGDIANRLLGELEQNVINPTLMPNWY